MYIYLMCYHVGPLQVNRTLMRNLIRMLTSLGIYKEKFLGPLLVETESYFYAEGLRKMENTNVPTFLLHVEKRLQEVGFFFFFFK